MISVGGEGTAQTRSLKVGTRGAARISGSAVLTPAGWGQARGDPPLAESTWSDLYVCIRQWQTSDS